MTRIFFFVLVGLTASCQRPSAPAAAAAAPAEAPPESATRWSARTELFVEYPPLVAGRTSRFAIHFTRLDTFRAIAKGSAEVRLRQGDAPPQTFRVEAPSRPGIFGVDVQPARAGEVRLSIGLAGEGIVDRHDLGLVPVAATSAAAGHGGAKESGETVVFLKEQQWTLDFATALVENKAMSAALRVPAEVEPRSGGRAEVDAPFDGRVVLDPVPVIGSRIEAGQVMARLLLPVNNAGDLPGLELARSEGQAVLQLARKDRDRAERLVKSGAVPAKRVDEAATALLTAEARLTAAETRLAQFEASRQVEGDVPGTKPFAVKAPISGLLETVKAAPGANVKAGEALFQIVDLDTVYVSAIVPESEFPRMRSLTGAELEIPGVDAPQRLAKLVTIGRVVDAPSRTFPVIYQVDNRRRLIAINQTVYVRLLFEAGAAGAAIPESAIVDDGGRPIVFVQQSGEAFLRRPVKLGERSGGWVRALEGVTPGERVVTKGAHLIRLAAMSNQVPAHGHVH